MCNNVTVLLTLMIQLFKKPDPAKSSSQYSLLTRFITSANKLNATVKIIISTHFKAGVTSDVSREKRFVSKRRVKSLGISSLSCKHDLTESASLATSGNSL